MRRRYYWLYSFLVNLFFSSRKRNYYFYRKTQKSQTTHYLSHPKPQWVKVKVIYLKDMMGEKTGCRKIANHFNHLYGKRETVGKTYVANIIRDNRYLIMQERRKLKNKLPRWVAVHK